MDKIKRQQITFTRRTNRIERSELVLQTKTLVQEIHTLFKEAALEHWKRHGNDASTGWGQPEMPYVTPRDPEDVADEVATKLTESVLWPF